MYKRQGNNGQWGWGYFEHEYFDENKLTVENHAMGGTSSRTFYNRLWPDVLKGVRKGDWVIIELGHNDNGPYDTGPAMALYRLGEKVIPAVLLLLSVAYIVDASYNPFLYFRF